MSEKKSFWWWIIFILLCIWQLPQLIVAAVMIPFLGKLELVADRHYNFCFKGERMRGGISLGPLAFVSKISAENEKVIAHETDGHTVDSKWMGPLYLFIVGIPSLLNTQLRFTKCYYDFYPEKWANNHAGLTTDERCRLIWKE